MDIPTPTPLPAPSGTALPDFGAMVDGAAFTQQLAMEGVQWWNIINQNDIFSYAQLALLIGIIIVGIVLIKSALEGDEGENA